MAIYEIILINQNNVFWSIKLPGTSVAQVRQTVTELVPNHTIYNIALGYPVK